MGHRGRSIVTLGTLTALAGLAVACTSSEQGTPAPATGGSSGPPTASSGPATSTGGAPASPVDLTSVNPCELFGTEVSAVSGTDGKARKAELPRLPGATACFQSGTAGDTNNVGLMIGVSPSTDVKNFSQSMASGVQEFTVAGHPAVVIAPKGLDAVCFAGVGMAEHQMLYLQYGLANPGSKPKTPQTELCAKLRPIAEKVVAELTP